MSLQKYAEYKESGIEWLGEVPAHWVVTQIKYVAQINPSKSELKTIPPDTPVTFLPMESIGETGRLDIRNSKPLSEVVSAGYTYLAENDVIIAKITPCFENGKGAIATGLLNGIAFATTEVVPFRCFKINNQYLYFLLSSSPFRKIAEGSMYGAGGQKRVSETFFANYKCCIPPTNEEQKQIAAFLDKETTKIDTLIDKQEQLITLLQEKRQAVISHAVTRGLNPNVKMKDSGVEWLGEVPEHWMIGKVKYVTENLDKSRVPLSSLERGKRPGIYPYYGASGIIDYIDDYLFDEDTILFGEDGANLLARSTPLAFLATGKYWVNNHAHVLKARDGLNRFWVWS